MKELQINKSTEMERNENVIATEIKVIRSQTNKIILSSAIEIGKRLKEVKQMIGHGNWENWLETEVSYSQRTATNLIRIYDEYGALFLENQIGNRVADLGYTQAVAMLKLDFEDRESFMEENDVPSMSKRDLEAAIKEKNDILREKEKLEAQIEEIMKGMEVLETNIDNYEVDIANQSNEIKVYQGQIEKLRLQVKESDSLRMELEKAKSQVVVDPEKVKTLEDSLKKANENVRSLNTELDQKKKEIQNMTPVETEKIVEVEVVKTVEVIPEATKTEIETLKKKLNASEHTIKYKATFEVIVNLFDDLVGTLNTIKKADPEQYEKFRGATNKLLEQLKQ
jgi:hypothetical protein